MNAATLERARYIVVEGPIGVGKTTLTRILAERFGGVPLLEAVEENPFLPLFYEDPQKHAFQTQLFFLLSRFQQQQSLPQTDLFRQATISDYLFAKDRIFATLTLGPAELALYDRVYQHLQPRVVRPDLVVYLQARLDVLLARIRKRGRAFERDFDADYLARLASTYSDFFFHWDETPLLVVNTSDIDIVESEEDLESLIQVIRRHRSGTQHYIPRGSR